MTTIEIIKTDITQLRVDAIVNAANQALCGGGGVDGAIHKAAGSELLAECRTLGPCATGFAKITQGYHLPAKYIIHAVGPVWHGGHKNEAALLASCYRESLNLATANDIKSIAFPAISCGAYRFPVPQACAIAMNEVLDFTKTNTKLDNIVFACFEAKIERELTQQLKTQQHRLGC